MDETLALATGFGNIQLTLSCCAATDSAVRVTVQLGWRLACQEGLLGWREGLLPPLPLAPGSSKTRGDPPKPLPTLAMTPLSSPWFSRLHKWAVQKRAHSARSAIQRLLAFVSTCSMWQASGKIPRLRFLRRRRRLRCFRTICKCVSSSAE